MHLLFIQTIEREKKQYARRWQYRRNSLQSLHLYASIAHIEEFVRDVHDAAEEESLHRPRPLQPVAHLPLDYDLNKVRKECLRMNRSAAPGFGAVIGNGRASLAGACRDCGRDNRWAVRGGGEWCSCE